MSDLRELTSPELDLVGGGKHNFLNHDTFVLIATKGGTNNVGNMVAGNQRNAPFSFVGDTFIFN